MDRIAVLEAENANLKLQLSGKTNYCVSCAGWAKQVASLKAETKSLRKQIKRLRAELDGYIPKLGIAMLNRLDLDKEE